MFCMSDEFIMIAATEHDASSITSYEATLSGLKSNFESLSQNTPSHAPVVTPTSIIAILELDDWQSLVFEAEHLTRPMRFFHKIVLYHRHEYLYGSPFNADHLRCTLPPIHKHESVIGFCQYIDGDVWNVSNCYDLPVIWPVVEYYRGRKPWLGKFKSISPWPWPS